MANPWFRLWGDMVNDPKWRTISRVSGQKIGDVISVYVHMMTCASNATERGRTQGWSDEDVATALDINTDQVEAIRLAMQGRVLDDDYLSGWDKRQPLREDGASERAKAFRDRKKNAETELQTQPNATERNQSLDKRREEEIREEKKEQKNSSPTPVGGTRFEEFWSVYPRHVARKVVEQRWKNRKLDRVADSIIANVRLRLSGDWCGKDMQFIPLPLTYVNQDRWDDETDAHGKPANSSGVPEYHQLRGI